MASIIYIYIYIYIKLIFSNITLSNQIQRCENKGWPTPQKHTLFLRVSLPHRSDFSGHKKRREKQPYSFDLKNKGRRRRRRNHGFQLSPLIQIQTGFAFLLSISDHLPPFQSSILFLTLDSDSSLMPDMLSNKVNQILNPSTLIFFSLFFALVDRKKYQGFLWVNVMPFLFL